VTSDCGDAGCEVPLPALDADEFGAEVAEDEQAVATTRIAAIAAASWSSLPVVDISAVPQVRPRCRGRCLQVYHSERPDSKIISRFSEIISRFSKLII
jgi:hypothetical protein